MTDQSSLTLRDNIIERLEYGECTTAMSLNYGTTPQIYTNVRNDIKVQSRNDFLERMLVHNVVKLLEGSPASEWINLACSRSGVTTLRHTQGRDCNVVKPLGSSSLTVDHLIDDDVYYFVDSLGFPAVEWTTSLQNRRESMILRVVQPKSGLERLQ